MAESVPLRPCEPIAREILEIAAAIGRALARRDHEAERREKTIALERYDQDAQV
jgi:hypothetical protein